MANLGITHATLLPIMADFWALPSDSTLWSTYENNQLQSYMDSGIRNVHYPRPTAKFPDGHQFSWSKPFTELVIWPTLEIDSNKTVTATFSSPTSTVTASEPMFHPSMVGQEIFITSILNGTFAADTDWTKGSGWTIEGGVAVATGAISTDLSQTVAPLISGNTYKVTYTVTVSAGSVAAICGTASGKPRRESGTYTEEIVANGTGFKFTGSGFTGTIDDVTVEGIFPITGYTSSTVITTSSNATCTAKTFHLDATGDYRLPSTFGGLAGPISFADTYGLDPLRVILANSLMQRRRQTAATGTPVHAAIDPVASDSSAEQVWNLMLEPVPGEERTLKFQYFLLPTQLIASTNIYPLGGPAYAELVIESCLAAIERRNPRMGTTHQIEFERLIDVAIQYDIDAMGPEVIGYNGSRSSGRWREGGGSRLNRHDTSEPLVQYNGYPARS